MKLSKNPAEPECARGALVGAAEVAADGAGSEREGAPLRQFRVRAAEQRPARRDRRRALLETQVLLFVLTLYSIWN